jgi:hypothetical protein
MTRSELPSVVRRKTSVTIRHRLTPASTFSTTTRAREMRCLRHLSATRNAWPLGFFRRLGPYPRRRLTLNTRILAQRRVGGIAPLGSIRRLLVVRVADHRRPQRDLFGGGFVDEHEGLGRRRLLLAALRLLGLRGVGGTLAPALRAVSDPLGGPRKRQRAGGDPASRHAPAPRRARLKRVGRRGASDASRRGAVVGSDRMASRAWCTAARSAGRRGLRAACLPSAARHLWRRRRSGVGAPCLPKSCLADRGPQRPQQRPAAHAQTRRVSVRSRRGTLSVCLVRLHRLAYSM